MHDKHAVLADGRLTITISSQAIARGKTIIAAQGITDEAHRSKLLVGLVHNSHQLLIKLNASQLKPELHNQMQVPNNECSRLRYSAGLLAPDIQKMLLQCKSPPHILPEMLVSRDLPMDWEEQRRWFGLG